MGRPSPYTAVAAAAGVQPQFRFSLEGMEVVQVIQNLQQEVPLVANKTTVVRCYLSVPAGSPLVRCRGELSATGASAEAVSVASLNETEVAPLSGTGLGDLRAHLERSLNFQLPPQACVPGNLTVTLVSLSTASNPPTPPAAGGTGPVTVAFLSAPPLRVKLFSIRHKMGNPPKTFEPTARDVQLTGSWLRRAYPVPEVILSHTTIDAPQAWPFSCDDVNLQLAGIRRQDVANGEDGRTHYYGMVSDANGASFMRGCAADIPDHAAPNTVASGPAGTASFDWDFDGSYADWYTAHELAHTFGRFHPGFCAGNSSDDPNYPYPDGSLTDDAGGFVGLDVGDSAVGVAMKALPGITWKDVMTYCENQWISAYTYNGIRERLAAESTLDSTPPPAPLGGAMPDAVAPKAAPTPTGMIHVLASLDLEHNTGRIVQVNPVKRGSPSRPTPGSPAVIRILDAAGAVLLATPLRIKESTCCEDKHRRGMLDALLPVPEGAHQVRLLMGDTVVDTFTAMPMPDEPGWLSARVDAPAVAAAPVPEAVSADEKVRYMIEISGDDGRTWQTIATGLRQPRFDPDMKKYPGLDHLLLRITATDGFSIQTTRRTLSLK